jgi:hypothetical protein
MDNIHPSIRALVDELRDWVARVFVSRTDFDQLAATVDAMKHGAPSAADLDAMAAEQETAAKTGETPAETKQEETQQ